MGKSAPKPPDPVKTAEAQSEANIDAAYESARLNQMGQYTPWGSLTYSGTIGAPDRALHVNLSPQQQAQFDSTNWLKQGLLNSLLPAQARGGYYPGAAMSPGRYPGQGTAPGPTNITPAGTQTPTSRPVKWDDVRYDREAKPWDYYDRGDAGGRSTNWNWDPGVRGRRATRNDAAIEEVPGQWRASTDVAPGQFGAFSGREPYTPSGPTGPYGGGPPPESQGTPFLDIPALRQRAMYDMGGLSPGYKDLYENLDTSLNQIGQDWQLARPGDYNDATQRLEQATYDRGYNLLSPELARREEALAVDLANRGLPFGSGADLDARNRLDESTRRQLSDMALGAVGAGRQEHERLANLTARNRGQLTGERFGLFGSGMQARKAGFDEARTRYMDQVAADQRQLGNLSQIMAMAGVTPPNFQNQAQYQVEAPDIQGAMSNNYAQQMAGYGSNMGFLGAIGSAIPWGTLFSDERVKDDHGVVGKVAGLPVHEFNYKGDSTPRIGFMAQEVEKKRPEAVTEIGGVKAVNYPKAMGLF